MQWTRVMLLGALALMVAGCGAVEPVATSPLSRAAVALRSSCPGWADGEIVESLFVIDGAWQSGASHQLSYDVNLAYCEIQTSTQLAQFRCLTCWDAMVDYVYFVWH